MKLRVYIDWMST